MPRLVIKRASSKSDEPADRNEGGGRPYANTESRQGYTSKSIPSLRGGATPGRGTRGTGPQRAGKQTASKYTPPPVALNGLQQQVDDKPGKVPYSTEEQRAKLQDRLLGLYEKRQEGAKRDADKKRLGRKFNGSSGPTISKRRITRTQNT